MSKRAEEAALKAYPDDNFVSVEYADMCRSFYQEGYELAEKDFLEKAVKWLLTQKNIGRVFITNFRKAMEEDE